MGELEEGDVQIRVMRIRRIALIIVFKISG
jgi:hypothetical protein